MLKHFRKQLASEAQLRKELRELRTLNQSLEACARLRANELAAAKIALSHEVKQRRMAQERFRHTFEMAPYGMMIVDHAGRIALVNHLTEILFGYDRNDLLGREIEVLVPERFRSHHGDKVAEFIANPQARAMGAGRELFGQRRDGSEFPIEIGLHPMQTEEGFFVLGAIVDITERKRYQEAQSQSDLRFRGIFDHTFGLIGLLRADGAVLEVNKPALDFRGLSLPDVAGRPLWETPWFDASSKCREDVRTAVETAASGEMTRREIAVNDGQGELRIFDFIATPVISGAGRVELLIAEGHDITDQKQMETQFRQAQKMEAVGLLAGGIAHEFNNLLQAICGYTRLALEGLIPGEQRFQDLELVLVSAERATVLTRQLLSLGRYKVLQRTHINPNQVVADLTKLLRPLIGENIELRQDLAPDVDAVNADAGQLQQVLLNLCINARDAMSKGGCLTFRSQNVNLPEGICASHPKANPGHYVLLSVIDTGCGMTAEVKARIFEPFFTTKETGKGTGLGLAMVYGMVEHHAGFIDVESEPNRGTTFKIYLPIAVGEGAPVEEPSPDCTRGGKETILVAEDESTVRDLAVRILTQAGYSVIVAADGAEAVELFEKHAHDVSLALLDAVMPKLTGHQAYDRIRRQNPNLPVVFCSGYDPESGHVKLLADEGVRMVQKPYDPAMLLCVVREALDATHLLEAATCTA